MVLPYAVTPAKAGVQKYLNTLGSRSRIGVRDRLRGNDEK